MATIKTKKSSRKPAKTTKTNSKVRVVYRTKECDKEHVSDPEPECYISISSKSIPSDTAYIISIISKWDAPVKKIYPVSWIQNKPNNAPIQYKGEGYAQNSSDMTINLYKDVVSYKREWGYCQRIRTIPGFNGDPMSPLFESSWGKDGFMYVEFEDGTYMVTDKCFNSSGLTNGNS